ncbi:hypothetical protein U91I_01915 [alpha proteobacterium U9-1i]|nr:hypothetical protein U91I_01915 [alpha proteobacterium U9-1i]
MNVSRRLFALSLAALALAPGEADARRGRGRGGDHDDARDAYERGEALSLSRVLPRALRAVPGEVLDVELAREHGRLVYEVDILARTGQVRTVVLDARNGAVLTLRHDHRGRHRGGDDDDDNWGDDD